MSTIQGIDCATTITASVAAKLVDVGKSFVGRYLPTGYSKSLTVSESRILTDAGLLILCFFETTADRAKGGSNNGQVDGASGYKSAQVLNMPTSSGICFTVDFEPTADQLPTIAEYFRAAREALGDYKLGAYGCYKVIEYLAAQSTCDFYVQCYAWSYTKKSDATTIYQYKNGQTVGGISVDLDEAYSTVGLWNYNSNGDDDVQYTDEQFKEQLLRVISVTGTGDTHSSWAGDAVTALKNAGVVNGDGAGNYGYQLPITREAAEKILYNALSKFGLLSSFKLVRRAAMTQMRNRIAGVKQGLKLAKANHDEKSIDAN
jgi:hypothetical protein